LANQKTFCLLMAFCFASVAKSGAFGRATICILEVVEQNTHGETMRASHVAEAYRVRYDWVFILSKFGFASWAIDLWPLRAKGPIVLVSPS